MTPVEQFSLGISGIMATVAIGTVIYHQATKNSEASRAAKRVSTLDEEAIEEARRDGAQSILNELLRTLRDELKETRDRGIRNEAEMTNHLKQCEKNQADIVKRLERIDNGFADLGRRIDNVASGAAGKFQEVKTTITG